MKVHGYAMVKNSIFKQLEHDNRHDKRNCRGLSLITDRSFSDFYCGLYLNKPQVQSEKTI